MDLSVDLWLGFGEPAFSSSYSLPSCTSSLLSSSMEVQASDDTYQNQNLNILGWSLYELHQCIMGNKFYGWFNLKT